MIWKSCDLQIKEGQTEDVLGNQTGGKWKMCIRDSTTVDVKASKLFSDDKVLVRCEELIDESKNEAILSRIDRMMI